MAGTAQVEATPAHPSDKLGSITGANLAQFDACL
jgi:hypothetical protein